MRRIPYLLSVLFLVSCGKYEYQGEFIGKKLSEVKIDAYTLTDSEALTLACSALKIKETQLESSIISEGVFPYTVRRSSCSGEFVTTEEETKIERSGQNFVFKAVPYGNFVFPNVETASNGILAKACQSVALFPGDYEEDNKIVIVRTAENGTECPREQGKVCLQQIKAEKDTQKIISRELIRIRYGANDQLRGFFDWRRIQGQAIGCAENQFTTIEARLKK